jgi:hypothetical protein
MVLIKKSFQLLGLISWSDNFLEKLLENLLPTAAHLLKFRFTLLHQDQSLPFAS